LCPSFASGIIRSGMKVTEELQSITRTRARYADPANRYVAAFASPWRRGAAAAIDWALCFAIFLVVSIPLGMVQTLGTVSREGGDLGGVPGHALQLGAQVLMVVCVAAYWAILLPTSQTYGMRAMDVRSVSVRTGKGLSYLVAAFRAAVTTVMGAAFYAVYLNSTDYATSAELDETSLRLLDISYVLVGIGCFSALMMLVTPTRRSLFDRLFGTAVLHELEAVAPRMGPWGPLDAFDTSR
jgi:uncharacterized RDD family membrane protein YckC